MRILVVCPQLPFPLIDGAKKGVYYPLKYLSGRGHQIHLACLSDRPDPASVRELERMCTVDVVESSKTPTVRGAFLSLFGSTPYDLERFHNLALLDRIRQRLKESSFDLMQVEGIHAAFYALKVHEEFNIPIVLRVHNVQSVNLVRAAKRFRNPLGKLWIRYESRRVQKYERDVHARFEANLTVSESDSQILLAQNPAVRCAVVPAGVDLGDFAPVDRQEEPGTVLWLGALQWVPNQESFWWFYHEIVPRIIRDYPDVRINVVGSNPPADILAVRHPNIDVLGYVSDVREVIARAQVCVVPLRVGSGVRIKLMEMFAMRKAVVSTSVGCEGLNVVAEQQLLVADSPEMFAGCVVRLLRDDGLRSYLGVNALDHVRRHFSWESVAGLYEAAYLRVLSPHSSSKECR